MKFVRIVVGLVLALALLLGAAFLARAPEPPAAGSDSARRLEPGPLPIGSAELRFVDRSRPTDANGDFPGAPERTFEATLWYPADAPGPQPLLVYSHGFMSMRGENVPLAELLASHGYVVESQFARDPAERASQASFLSETLPRDFRELAFEAALPR